MFYNFRYDRASRTEFLRRLKEESVCCQGWSRPETPPITDGDFVPRCRDSWKLNSTRIPSSLTWIRSFQKGDVLAIPHCPEDGKVTFCFVAENYPVCYAYEPSDSERIGHRIAVTRRSLGLDGEISIYNYKLLKWCSSLGGFRLPIVQLYWLSGILDDVVRELSKDPSLSLPATDLGEYLRDIHQKVCKLIQTELGSLPPSRGPVSFERVCEFVVKEYGYKRVQEPGRRFDGKGGDVDIQFNRHLGSPFEEDDSRLFVQVKRHVGVSDERGVEQLRKRMESEGSTKGCVITLADTFNEKAKDDAHDQGIQLVDGPNFADLFLTALVKARSAGQQSSLLESAD